MTGGDAQVPSRIGCSGQLARRYSENGPAGAGSQLLRSSICHDAGPSPARVPVTPPARPGVGELSAALVTAGWCCACGRIMVNRQQPSSPLGAGVAVMHILVVTGPAR